MLQTILLYETYLSQIYLVRDKCLCRDGAVLREENQGYEEGSETLGSSSLILRRSCRMHSAPKQSFLIFMLAIVFIRSVILKLT